ncbi:MAG: hypothetical protein AAGG38_07665 [Planctomycetota bacterium]
MASIFTVDAMAAYHPGLGRFVQRDPHVTSLDPTLGRTSNHMVPGGGQNFLPLDAAGPRSQYADGSSLYQYVGSAPLSHRDPSGLKRIIAVLNGQDGLQNKLDPIARGMLVHSIQNEAWATDRENHIVKFFEEDADWSHPRASKWIEEQNEEGCHTVILIGHSNGGDGALKVAKQLDQDVDLLYLLDPVQKPWHLDGKGPQRTRSVSGNVLFAISIYQRDDKRYFGVGFGPLPGVLMQGYRLSNGRNVLWRAPFNPPDGKGPNDAFAHTEIVYDPSVKDDLATRIGWVPLDREPK